MKHLQYSQSMPKCGFSWWAVAACGIGKVQPIFRGCWLVASCEVFANKLPLRGPNRHPQRPLTIFLNHYTKREHISVAQPLPPKNEVSSNDEVTLSVGRDCRGRGLKFRRLLSRSDPLQPKTSLAPSYLSKIGLACLCQFL